MLKSKRFWAYEPCQAFELKQEFMDNYKIKGKFYDDVLYFYEQMGVAPHPSLKSPIGKEQGEPSSLSFINNKVDINTIKIMLHLLPFIKIVSLKFCSNLFEIDNLSYLINNLISKQNNIFFLMYEWNPQLTINGSVYSIEDSLKQSAIEEVISAFKMQSQLMVKLVSNTRFECLCLRGNFMGDVTAIDIFNTLATNNTSLKVISLYQNNLTSKCTGALCTMLEKNKKIEEINLGKNHFKNEDLDALNKYMGKYLMSTEELENYNKKAKERDLILAKNVKLRITKKPEIEVPFLDDITQIDDKYYILKNNRIKVFNFMANNLTNKCFNLVKYMLDYNDDLLLTLDDNLFSKEEKDILLNKNSNYFNRIYFSKC